MLKEILIFAALSSSAIFCNAQKLSKTAQELEKQGYVNIHTLDKTIVVDLMYSRADNFTGKVLYTDLKEAYLEKEAAKLDKADLEKYRQIKLHCTPPMAKLVNGQCSGCFMSLPSATLLEISKGERIVECDNCGRILYDAGE